VLTSRQQRMILVPQVEIDADVVSGLGRCDEQCEVCLAIIRSSRPSRLPMILAGSICSAQAVAGSKLKRCR
jgi:hypothetical protein